MHVKPERLPDKDKIEAQLKLLLSTHSRMYQSWLQAHVQKDTEELETRLKSKAAILKSTNVK